MRNPLVRHINGLRQICYKIRLDQFDLARVIQLLSAQTSSRLLLLHLADTTTHPIHVYAMALSKSPSLTRFLSDFTLGFSDGLTVPFALTAGLSSLGKADTVIYAGLADLCAGSISMGIGGYLSALDELPAAPATQQQQSLSGGDAEELRGMLHRRGSHSDDDDSDDHEKGDAATAHEQLVLRHLEPLCLSATTAANIVATLRSQPGGLDRAVSGIEAHNDVGLAADAPLPIWPVASGCSIALGYAIGGAIPLLPYFFTATVGLGLRWSIGLCLIALMSFGTGKKWLLGGENVRWRQCVWAGLQMLALGTIAAAAAVACVNMLGSVAEGTP